MGSKEKEPLNVFIDSCILLNIYELSGPDLDEFKKISELTRSGKLVIYDPQQVVNEFWRNREGGVAEAVKRFKETKANAVLPNLVRSYRQIPELKTAIKQVDTLVREITASVETDISSDSLTADEVVTDLLGTATLIDSDEELVKKARLRRELGNPPGKKGSLGDALNWESLLKAVPVDNELIVISSDGDYESPLSETKIKEFLVREWNAQKKSKLTLYKSLPAFLQGNFPEIRLSSEIAKLTAIERLEGSGSYSETHNIISKLDKVSGFNDNELERISKACLENGQVYRILEDEDVLAFAKKIVRLSGTKSLNGVNELKTKIDEIEAVAAE